MIQFWLLSLSTLLGLAALPFNLFVGVLVLFGYASKKDPNLTKHPRLNIRYRFLVLVPAHNEEESIATTIKSATELDTTQNQCKILVIADNCTDRTAQVAASHGALVYERTDKQRRGKGYALEDVTKNILNDKQFDDIDALVIVDADSTLDPKLLDHFALSFQNGSDFAQCYDTISNPEGSWRTQLLTYAFGLFNGTYLLGLDRSGLGAHLRGNGMGFTRAGLLRQPWKAASLAEDLEFSWNLRLRGESVSFVGNTSVFAEMPTNASTSKSQRARWEHGRKQLKTLFTNQTLGYDAPLLKRVGWLLDLWMPPLSALFILTVASAALLFASFSINASKEISLLLIVLCAINLGAFLLYVFSPFFLMNLPLRFLRSLIYAPYYALWRAVILLGKKPNQWIRTARIRRQEEDR